MMPYMTRENRKIWREHMPMTDQLPGCEVG